MKKRIVLFVASVLMLASCRGASTSSNDAPSSSVSSSEISSSVAFERKTYSNPIRFYRQDGSEYFVAAADPHVIYGNDGYYYLYITNANCEMGDKGILFDRGPISEVRI